jgi:hypothetical protein
MVGALWWPELGTHRHNRWPKCDSAPSPLLYRTGPRGAKDLITAPRTHHVTETPNADTMTLFAMDLGQPDGTVFH